MEKLVKGDVIVVPFPFSDLSSSKKRPALVAANLEDEDIILCQITSEAKLDDYLIVLGSDDFKRGNLNLASMIRPNRMFTADRSIVLYKIGSLKEKKINEVDENIIRMFRD